MGMRVLHVTSALVEHLLTHGTRCARPTNAPHDLEILDVRFDAVRGMIDLIVRSGSWDEVPLLPDPSGRPNGWLGDRLQAVALSFVSFV